MPARFALRIESGEQAGETHVLGDGGLTVGRRPGNDLVIRDASVSGRHARFSIEGAAVKMVDLQSTNGSFVDEKRVGEARLEAGAFLRIGAVELELVALAEGAETASAAETGEIELEIEAPGVPAAPAPVRRVEPPKPAPVAAAELEAGELRIEGLDEPVFDDDLDGMHQIDSAALAKSKRGPGLVPLLAGVLVLGGAAGWYFMGMPGLGDGGGATEVALRDVVAVPGNLLRDGSFESSADVTIEGDDGSAPEGDWNIDAAADLVPFASEAWRYGGKTGLGADLEAGESARVRSAATTLGRQRALEGAAFVNTEGTGAARLGIELFDAAGEHPTFVAWSPVARDAMDTALEVQALAPAGYDRARVVLELAGGAEGGAVGFDDVSLVAGDSGEAVQHEDFSLAMLGSGRVALAFVDRPLLVDMTGTAPSPGQRGLAFTVAAGGFGVTVDPALFAEGFATLGTGGYRPHADAFTDAGVTSVVIGSGVHQLRLVFPAAVELSGRPLAGGYHLEAETSPGTVQVELGFTEERARAARLDRQAREAEGQGQRGQALARWQELLDDVPFDGELVLEAEAGRARLIGAGLAEVEALRGDFERAAFFGLPDLYRAVLEGVEALRVEFDGNEVADAASALGVEVRAALAAVGARDAEAQRLAEARQAVLALAKEAGYTDLAKHIETAVEGGSSEETN
jgi:hypothetical protein